MQASTRLLLPLFVALPFSIFAQQAQLLEKENIVEAAEARGAWQPAQVGQPLGVNDRVRTGELSRAAIRLTNSSVVRLNQRTNLTILPPDQLSPKGGIDLLGGAAYLFSRERPQEIRVRTPSANGITRGTQIVVTVTPALKTLMTVFEGQVELTNAQGSVLLNNGEQGEAEIGKAPRKTAVIDAVNILQWALYYPAVLDPGELGMNAGESRAVSRSLAAYREGDLLGALEKYPASYRPTTSAGQLYRAAVLLAVGRVDHARQILTGLKERSAGRQALERMIAAVQFRDAERTTEPGTAGEWIADSYYEQSKSRLEPAREAARRATALRPDFGYAWVRLAELEFSFGRTRQALAALERGLQTTPRNAQGHALRGFLLSAQNRIEPARAAFDEAIALDGALGNAWLGRGLTFIRQGEDERGRQDLQVAAAMEPNRSILHSYLGKAFSQIGDTASARKDLARARELDPNDPTPWLYSALQNKQENRYNEAVTDLEQSLTLNENRRVYRSEFLLDQDRGVRSTNLASIYLNNGMVDLSVREATRAVNADYASAGAHLFLANSFNALRDPRRILLRYETAWFNELLLSNLLSPVGGGPLSQFVSQYEYSKLFEADGFGISSLTDYFSYGELRHTSSQYGTFGNFSYALDAEYLYNDGRRPNNEISRLESYATFKLQLGPQDTLFFQAKFQDLQLGDVFQRYDDDEVGRETVTEVVGPDGERRKVVSKNIPAKTFDFRERQEPGLLLLGYHHEWDPGDHTILLLGRLANDQVLTADSTPQLVFTRDISADFSDEFDADTSDRPLSSRRVREELKRFRGRGDLRDVSNLPLDFDYHANFEIYSAELNQILTRGPMTFVLGSRLQKGYFETHHTFDDLRTDLRESGLFRDPPSNQDYTVDFERVNLYAYDIWRVAPWLTITGGVTYDKLRYPENYRTPPINDDERVLERVSPKAGFTLAPHRTLLIRGAYTEAISGASFDESVRLEPTQIAGFNQAYRTIISEDIVGSVAGATYKTLNLSLEQKLPTRTYWAIEYNLLQQDLDRKVGVFDFLTGGANQGVLPSQVDQQLVYREDVLTASVNQLVGDRWSFGARYQFSKAKLRRQYRNVSQSVFSLADSTLSSRLHQVGLFALYNHPTGFFARGEAWWFNQENDGFARDPVHPRDDPRPGDSFWQLNAFAGYRFYRNQCELSCGVLNLTNTDYELEPLNYYLELPRERTLFVRLKFTF